VTARCITQRGQEEYSALCREIAVLAEFFDTLYPGQYAEIRRRMESLQPPPVPFRQALAGLREGRSDLIMMAGLLPGEQQRRLDAHLRERLGVSLDSLQTTRMGRLSRLRQKGRITTDEQFRLVRRRLDQIEGDPPFAGEARDLSSLAADYEATAMRRRGRQ
jgi:hypothetical protein